jgi:pilus assembly protein FimV
MFQTIKAYIHFQHEFDFRSSEYEQEELAADLLSDFMIPELHRILHREKVDAAQIRYKKAAGQVLDAVFSAHAMSKEILDTRIPPLVTEHCTRGWAAADGTLSALDGLIHRAVEESIRILPKRIPKPETPTQDTAEEGMAPTEEQQQPRQTLQPTSEEEEAEEQLEDEAEEQPEYEAEEQFSGTAQRQAEEELQGHFEWMAQEQLGEDAEEEQLEEKVQDQPEGEDEDQPEGEAEDQSEGEAEEQLEGEAEEQLEGEADEQLEGEAEEQLEGEAEDQLEGKTEDQPEEEVEGQPEQDAQLEEEVQYQPEPVDAVLPWETKDDIEQEMKDEIEQEVEGEGFEMEELAGQGEDEEEQAENIEGIIEDEEYLGEGDEPLEPKVVKTFIEPQLKVHDDVRQRLAAKSLQIALKTEPGQSVVDVIAGATEVVDEIFLEARRKIVPDKPVAARSDTTLDDDTDDD